jgi:hypothetical protein
MLHLIEADIRDGSPMIEDLAAAEVARLEALLAKHAAFRAFLEENGLA